MSRILEIRECIEPESYWSNVEDKAYDCGFDAGYKKAMAEMASSSKHIDTVTH